MTASVDWYFDFVSPYSYLALHRLAEIPRPIAYRPVLFAGLLKHWGQKGPAEIPAKRRWTYRSCTFRARQLGVPFRFPASHPFNPLQHLRLALACGSSPQAVKRIFESIWMSGANANDPDRFSLLCKALEVDPTRLAEPAIKDALRRNTEEAVARSVFGVPTLLIDGEAFWGEDGIDFAKAFIADAGALRDAEMRRVDELPVGAPRRVP
ncbi:MAG TPA: 2-hydroxychromene-2-carboxylate isomerase [Stellaceae bacterium]|nr:2-hydroxychromene-2-carboxylate isomerase [Stellaceae bacterium]